MARESSTDPRPESQSLEAPLMHVLERKLRGILDQAMRRHVVLECLEAADPREVHAVIALMVLGKYDDNPTRTLLRELLVDLLSQDDEGDSGPTLSYRCRREVYTVARDMCDDASMALLRSQPMPEADESHHVRVPKQLEEISLGMRRSLAKQDDPHRLEQLSRDPDPIVIKNLLRNPRLREEDVVRIAALRPVPGSTLREISRCPRWSRLPRIRAALARNPHTPVELCLKLILSLSKSTLHEIQSDPDLHPDVQQRVKRELDRRTDHDRA